MTETSTVMRLHLNAPNMSGRWVEFHDLSATKIRNLESEAASSIGKGAMLFAVKELAVANALCAMVERVSAPDPEAPALATELYRLEQAVAFIEEKIDPENQEQAQALQKSKDRIAELMKRLQPPEKWITLTELDLSTPGGERSWDRIFTAKETECLTRLYRARHEMTEADIRLMEGKVQTLARS